MTTPNTYLGWYEAKQPIAAILAHACQRYAERFGVAATAALVPVAALAEAQAAWPQLEIRGEEWVRPGTVLVR